MSQLKSLILDATKVAMKARDKPRVAALRLVQADIKRVEVDERKALSDQEVIAVLTRMLKQRRDSLSQFQSAGRRDLADQEQFEIDVITEFMPAALSEAEVDGLIEAAIAATGAGSMRDMGKVMAKLKADAQGRTDMAALSAKVRAKLTS